MMAEPLEQPPIPEELLATCRDCYFLRRVFRPRDAWMMRLSSADVGEQLNAPETNAAEPYRPDEPELIKGGWDHERCDACSVRIEDGDTYWANDGEAQVDLCDGCYSRVRALIRA
jgi:hypothetical protein